MFFSLLILLDHLLLYFYSCKRAAEYRTTVADLSLLYYDSTKHDVRTLILLRIWSAIFYAPVKVCRSVVVGIGTFFWFKYPFFFLKRLRMAF